MNTNQSVLQETKDVQQRTLEALRRTRNCAAESNEVGTKTLAELEEQGKRLNKATTQTDELVDTLKKTHKAQNKYALWAGQWSNTKRAKKELRREEELIEEQLEIPLPKNKTFKRRGKRPPKPMSNKVGIAPNTSSTANIDSSNWHSFPDAIPVTDSNNRVALDIAYDKSLQTSKDINTELNRNELFSNKAILTDTEKHDVFGKPTASSITVLGTTSNQTKKKKERKRTRAAPRGTTKSTTLSTATNSTMVPLTEEDENELKTINNTDKMVDREIDALGDQVTDLLALSKAIGYKAENHTSQLEAINDNLDETKDRTKIINKRLKLFTTTRRERNRKEKEFKQNMNSMLPPGTKATVAASGTGF